MKEKNISSML